MVGLEKWHQIPAPLPAGNSEVVLSEKPLIMVKPQRTAVEACSLLKVTTRSMWLPSIIVVCLKEVS